MEFALLYSDHIKKRSRNGAQLFAITAVVLGVVLLFICLQFDAFSINPQRPHAVSSWVALLFGVLSASLSWYANPLLVFSWVTLPQQRYRHWGLVAAFLALALSLWFLTTIGHWILTHEGGGDRRIVVGVDVGYWLWVASISVTFLCGAVSWALSPARKADPTRFLYSTAFFTLTAIGFIFSLQIVLPAAAIRYAALQRKLKATARTFCCVECGTLLDLESLRLANIAWEEYVRDLHAKHPGVKFKLVRDLFAICAICGTRYRYVEQERVFVPLDADKSSGIAL